MSYQLPQYAGLSIEASHIYDTRLAILGCYGDPTKAQYNIAFGEALAFDRETVRRARERAAQADNNLALKNPERPYDDGSSGAIPDGV